VKIRRAEALDAAAICAVVRASITDLCVPDHKGDADILERWLDNKTPQTVARWIANPDNVMLVAVEGEHVLAAGCIKRSGEIVLNYVATEARFRGASSAMLEALEAEARELGLQRCTLESTTTAHRFYLSRGYVDVAGCDYGKFGLACLPMEKRLG
jgi:GNAT superfamily N-acetyltransferase